MSTTHQIPRPPSVNSFPTPVPVRPRQNLGDKTIFQCTILITEYTIPPVKAEEAEEDAVEKRGHEVVVGVADAGETVPQEGSWPGALDAVQHPAARLALLHLLPPLAPVLEAAMSHLVVGRLVALVIVRFRALEELAGQEVTRDKGRGHHVPWAGWARAGVISRGSVIAGAVGERPVVVTGDHVTLADDAFLAPCDPHHCHECHYHYHCSECSAHVSHHCHCPWPWLPAVSLLTL